jgi:hypothetical protein
MNLELVAMRWLWLEKNCHYVVRERSPRWGMGEPDVLGVTKDRYLIEIEIKRSLSDFHADKNKHHRRFYLDALDRRAKYFYYLAEKSLAEKIQKRLPPYAGLISVENEHSVTVEVSAAKNPDSPRLSVKECVRMARQTVNHAMSLELRLSNALSNWRQGSYYEHYPVNGDFQI